jgi:hypothetical protein
MHQAVRALERVYYDAFYAFGVEAFGNGSCNPDDVMAWWFSAAAPIRLAQQGSHLSTTAHQKEVAAY